MPQLLSLPPEIITKIYIAIVVQGCSPIPFTHVNSRLRSIGISSSEVWTYVHIDFSTYFKKEERSRVRTYLERSRNRSINVTFDIPYNSVFHARVSEVIDQCLTRAEMLVINGRPPANFQPSLSSPAPRLIHLDIKNLDLERLIHGRRTLKAPNISTLRMMLQRPKDLEFLSKIQGPLRCLGLRIDKGGQYGVSSILGIIHDQAGSLAELELELHENILRPGDVGFLHESPLIEIPNLRHLALTIPTTRLLGKIAAPSLETFSMHVDKGIENPVEMDSDDLPCLLEFLIKHSQSLMDITLRSPSNWPSSESATARLALLPRGVVFSRLRTVDLQPGLGECQLLETITSTTLDTLSIGLILSYNITWSLLISFIRRNSMSIREIKITSTSHDEEPIQPQASIADNDSLLSLPNLRKIQLDCVGGGIVLASITFAPLLEYLEVLSSTPSEVCNLSYLAYSPHQYLKVQ